MAVGADGQLPQFLHLQHALRQLLSERCHLLLGQGFVLGLFLQVPRFLLQLREDLAAGLHPPLRLLVYQLTLNAEGLTETADCWRYVAWIEKLVTSLTICLLLIFAADCVMSFCCSSMILPEFFSQSSLVLKKAVRVVSAFFSLTRYSQTFLCSNFRDACFYIANIYNSMRLLHTIKRHSHTLETVIEANSYKRKELLQTIRTRPRTALEGHYDLQGSRNYQAKNLDSHYKQLISHPEIRVSAIGVGTYKGSLNEQDDLLQFNGLVDSLDCGVNVIDSCRNFRGGRSEIVVGQALHHLVQEKGYARNNFHISSKAGYVRNNIPKGVDSSHVVNDHCVHPLFLQSQLEQSLKNLGLRTIDVYYLNNFAESQLTHLESRQFDDRLKRAFEFLEQARLDGKIRHYGLSSWQAFRLHHSQKGYLNIEQILGIAEKVGGSNHGFRFVQLPINVFMPEVFAEKYKQGQSFLDLAEELRLNVVSNSPFLSGSLINVPMQANLLKCINNGAKHLQLIRSIPSKALVSTLVGQKLNRHVKKNLEVLSVPALDEGEWLKVFVPSTEPKPVAQDREEL